MKTYGILVMAVLVTTAKQHPCYICESNDYSSCQASQTVQNCDSKGCVTVAVSANGTSINNDTCPLCPKGITYATSPYYYKGCLDNGQFLHEVVERAGVGYTHIQYCFDEICNDHNSKTRKAREPGLDDPQLLGLNVSQVLEVLEMGIPINISGEGDQSILSILAG